MATRANEPWYEAASGVRIGRYRKDDDAATAIAIALDNGWAVLNHSVIAVPSAGFWLLFLFLFFRETEHVITFVKPPPG